MEYFCSLPRIHIIVLINGIKHLKRIKNEVKCSVNFCVCV